jgi:hypothetical protein
MRMTVLLSACNGAANVDLVRPCKGNHACPPLARLSAVTEELHPHDSFPVNKRICDAKTVDLSDAVTAFATLRSDRMPLARGATTAAQLSPAHAAGLS